jgi:integrase
MVEALRDTPDLAPCSRQNWTSKLRGFLASEGCPLATDKELWFCSAPVPRKRPYLEITRAQSILNAAKVRERLVVVLGLFNGLRACEMSRLRVRDLELYEQPPTMWVLGKGTRGGKPRRIPINPSAYAEIEQFVLGRRPEDPVHPAPFGAIDKDWRRAQRRAGFVPVGIHALRRSFGRNSHDAGTLTAEIQAVYGHAAESTTSKYIGVEAQRMARGRAQMATYFEEAR